MTTYQKYLNSEGWKRIREIALWQQKRKCKICGTKKKTLHVHHITYKHLGLPQEIKDLVVLCWECHEQVHKLPLEETEAFMRRLINPPKKQKKVSDRAKRRRAKRERKRQVQSDAGSD